MGGLVEFIGSIAIWTLFMEMNSSQDAVWSDYVTDSTENKKLHIADGIGVAAIGALLAYSYRGVHVESLLLGLFFFFSRCGYFSWRLNLKRIKRGRNIRWNHLADRGWDGLFKGNNTLYFLVCFVGMAGCIIWLCKEYV